MKIQRLITATFIVFLFTTAFCTTRVFADRNPISAYARFGDPLSGNCSGKGICSQSGVGAIPVTYTYVDHHTMIISFSMADLTTNQPDQVTYFQASSYMFDTHFNLDAATFGSWGLGAGAWINTTSTSTVTTINGIVYDTVEIEYYY